MSDKLKDISSSYLDSKIVKINAKEFHPNNFKKLWEIKRAIIYENIINKDSNAALYAKFAEIVHDKEYFEIDHIKQLGLDYDILIFQTEKNVGKSYNMVTRCNKIIEQGGKVVIMRIHEDHIKTGLSEQLQGEHSNFYVGADCKLYHKWNPNPKTGSGREQVGIAMALSNCVKWKGGSFDNYQAIFFDEATDESKFITIKEFRKFFISVANSIERRKESMPIEIFGNTDFNVSHPLFEVFEIDPDENLVYTTRKVPGAEKETKILYINSRGLYPKGAKQSRFIGAIGDPKAALDAFMNTVKRNTDKIVSIDLTYLSDPVFAFIFKESYKGETNTWQIVVNKYIYTELPNDENLFDPSTKTWYYIKIDLFDPSYLYGYKIYTDDDIMHMLYRNFTKYVTDGVSYWQRIKNIIKGGRCIFIRRQTEEILSKILERRCESEFVIS